MWLIEFLISLTEISLPAGFQIRGGIEDNSKIIFSFFCSENICCDPSLEPSQQDGFNNGSQKMF